MAVNNAADSPFQPRRLEREEATNDLLKAHTQQTHQDNQPFAAAVQTHQNALLGSSSPTPPKSSHRERWQHLHNTPPTADPTGYLMPQPSTRISQTSNLSQSSNLSAQSIAASKAQYARHMAASTSTRNGRELMGKATTMTSKWCVVWYSSAYTRPVQEMLREVLEVRYPFPASDGKRGEGELRGVLAGGVSGEGER